MTLQQVLAGERRDTAMSAEDVSLAAILEWPEMADVKAELSDPHFASRRHGSRATYALGCRGPLCKKKERDRARIRNETRAKAAKREYAASVNRKYDRDDLLDALFIWHVQDLAVRRVEGR